MSVEEKLAELERKVEFLNTENTRLQGLVGRQESSSPIVDNRAIGRPDIFKNTEIHWPDFYFKFTNWLVAIQPQQEKIIECPINIFENIRRSLDSVN